MIVRLIQIFDVYMNNRVKLIVVLLVLKQILANNNAIFALTWMAGHCQQLGTTCDRVKYEQWDHQSFTIHGLWPSQQTDGFYGKFNFQLFKGKPLLQEMYSYWPPQPKKGGFAHFLWQFQWQKNGNRYADIMMDLAPSNFILYGIKNRNQQLQVYYFTKTIELYKKLNVRKVPRKTYTKGQFSTLLNIPQQTFYFVCSQSGTFLQVRICYRITSTGFIARNCAKTISNCPGQYANLKDWRKNQIVIKQDPKTTTKSDAQKQQVLDKQKEKIVPAYKPMQQLKIDEKIQKISIDTKGKQDSNRQFQQIIIIGTDTKQITYTKEDILVEEEKERLQEIQMQEFNSEQSIDLGEKESSLITQVQLVGVVQKYMAITAFLVSIFWIAIIILFCKVFKNGGLNNHQNVGDNTVSNMQGKELE